MKDESMISYPMRCELCGAPPERELEQLDDRYIKYKEQCSCGGRIRVELWNPQHKEMTS